MTVFLMNNPLRSQLAPTRVKYREVQTTQIVHIKRHVLTIRYLKVPIFALWSLWLEPILENVRDGKALKEKPLRNLVPRAFSSTIFKMAARREKALAKADKISKNLGDFYHVTF